MKCPKCNRELKEGNLYCEVCGEEIKIVPDFEPEIENSIEETLSSMADHINEVTSDDVLFESEESKKEEKETFRVFQKEEKKVKESLLLEEFPDDEDFYDDIESEELSDESFWDEEEVIHFKGSDKIKTFFKSFWEKGVASKVIVFSATAVIIAALVFLAVIVCGAFNKNSYSYQVEQAEIAAEAGDYETAIIYLEKAIAMDSSDIDLRYLLADYYYKIGESENALLVLKGMLCGDTDTDINTYTKIFEIYSAQGKIIEISHMLSECEDPAVLEQFSQYIAKAPEFSEPEGSYDDVLYLKLTANTEGTIYYTVNGGTPDTTSEVYTSPIFLESGYYTVKAIFVNSYGLVSEIVSQLYEINVTVPPKPEVSVESGTYQVPELITVEVPDNCMTYYTTDGTTPSRDSILYKEPICMPLGSSKFTFVTYSSENVASEPVTVEYTFELPKDITVTAADAANLVTMHRFGMGGLMDTQGHLSTISGKLLYMCEAVVTLEDDIYFVVYEYYEDPNNLIRTKTGLVFCAAMHDQNKVGELEIDEQGNYYRVVEENLPQM